MTTVIAGRAMLKLDFRYLPYLLVFIKHVDLIILPISPAPVYITAH